MPDQQSTPRRQSKKPQLTLPTGQLTLQFKSTHLHICIYRSSILYTYVHLVNCAMQYMRIIVYKILILSRLLPSSSHFFSLPPSPGNDLPPYMYPDDPLGADSTDSVGDIVASTMKESPQIKNALIHGKLH